MSNVEIEAALIARVEAHNAAGIALLRELAAVRSGSFAKDDDDFHRRANAGNWSEEFHAEFNALDARKQALRDAAHAINTCGQGMRF